MKPAVAPSLPSGIPALDERIGGLEAGGTYLLVGAPGPAKLVATLQFLREGVAAGQPGLLLTNATAEDILAVSRAWGLPMDEAWKDGTLQVIGFRDNFELRAIRSIAPEEVLEELEDLVVGVPTRIAVDPGTMFLTGGARTLLASAFVAWARRQMGTVFVTFAVDADANFLPSAADWLAGATTARLIIEPRPGGLHQITYTSSVPGPDSLDRAVTLQLKAREGLVRPDVLPSRRGVDRAGLDPRRLLLVTLDSEHGADLRTWAGSAFTADFVSEAIDAVTGVQRKTPYGCIVVNAPRRLVRGAIQACRALRPLTRAAIVFASDDAIRSTDRVHLLEAGADDCLSGGLDFRELGVRIRQAIASGAKPPAAVEPTPVAPSAPPRGGRVSRDVFGREVERRAADTDRSFFCVLDMTSRTLPAGDFARQLTELLRSDEGDLVSVEDDHCLTLLQGAREGQAMAFLKRLRARLSEAVGGAADLVVTVLAHPGDARRIEELLGAAVGEHE